MGTDSDDYDEEVIEYLKTLTKIEQHADDYNKLKQYKGDLDKLNIDITGEVWGDDLDLNIGKFKGEIDRLWAIGKKLNELQKDIDASKDGDPEVAAKMMGKYLQFTADLCEKVAGGANPICAAVSAYAKAPAAFVEKMKSNVALMQNRELNQLGWTGYGNYARKKIRPPLTAFEKDYANEIEALAKGDLASGARVQAEVHCRQGKSSLRVCQELAERIPNFFTPQKKVDHFMACVGRYDSADPNTVPFCTEEANEIKKRTLGGGKPTLSDRFWRRVEEKVDSALPSWLGGSGK